MAHAKGPVAVVMPTEKAMQDWASQKFDPMAKDTPAIAAVMASRSNRASDNNAQRKRFTGGILYFKTAGSTTELKSTSLRYAIADEVDEWDWTTLQGDPLGLLEIRQTTYHDRKLFVVSSPTMKDASHHPELYLHKWRPIDWKRRALMLEPEQTTEPPTEAAKAETNPQPTNRGRMRRRVVSARP